MSWSHLFIGIDCGSTTGIAFYDPDRKLFILMKTTTFWKGYNLLTREINLVKNKDNIIIYVEDPKQLKVMYRKERYYKAKKRSTIEKLAYDAGQVGRESELMAEGLELFGYNVVRSIPHGSKPDDTLFRRTTKFDRPTNQHVRDAGWLVWGLSWKWSRRG